MSVAGVSAMGRLLDLVRLEEGSESGSPRRRRSSRSYLHQNDDFMKPTRDLPNPSDMYHHPTPHPTLSGGSPVRDRPSYSSRSSPLRASHDLGLTSFHADTDSGISTRLRPSFSSLSPRTHNTQDGLCSSRSYDLPSPRSSRSILRSSGSRGSHESLRSPPSSMIRSASPTRTPSAERKVSDLQVALDESEQRRVLLTQKLREAQDTIEHQSGRLKTVESSVRDTSSTVEELRNREKELQRRLTVSDRDRDEQQRRRLEEARGSKRLQDKMENLEKTLSSLQLQKNHMESEATKKKDVMDSVTSTLTLLEQENDKLAKAKESFTKELSALRESLDIARSRNSWLENHSKGTKGEVEKLRQENLKLAEEKRSLGSQLTEIKKNNLMLKEESSSMSTTMQGLKDEKFRVDHEVGRLRAALADIQASLASTTADKERYFREKLDLHQRVQQVSHDREALLKSKTSVEEQLNELQEQVTGARHGMDRMRAERAAVEEEFAAVKKVGEVLSTELSSSRSRLEKALEEVAALQQTHQLTRQQEKLSQQETHSLEKQVDTLKKSMENLRKDNSKEKEIHDSQQLKLKEELRHLKSERNQLELKVHELEARTKQSDSQLREQTEGARREVDTWRKNTEKAAASLGRRDAEIGELQGKIRDLEEEITDLREARDNHQAQYDELLESREELMRLREENRRLVQERGENQQVIQLLEMQKNILSKTSESNMDKAYDAEQLKCKVDQLTAENNLLQDKIQEAEHARDLLAKEKEERLWNSSDEESQSPRSGRRGRGGRRQAIIGDLEQQNEQLQEINVKVTEQLTRLEQENVSMKSRAAELLPKSDFQRVEAERATLEQDLSRVRIQYEQLEQRHHEVIAERQIAQSEEVTAARKDREAAEARLALVKGDLVLAENTKLRLEERVSALERQLEQSTSRAVSMSRDREQMAALELKCNQLKSDLEGARNIQAKQETLITSLREELEDEKTKKPSKIRQSLDDVGNELTNMRTELQKLLEVIQVKDQAIEDLEQQLKVTKREVSDRERTIEALTSSVQSNGDLEASERTDNDASVLCDDVQNCSGSSRAELLQRIRELESERDDLQQQMDDLVRERDLALQDAADLRDGLDDLQQMFDDDRAKLQEKFKREIRAKERQIECLEEQLRSSTNNELRKLKRDAGRMELLRTENRILQNQLNQSPRNSVLLTSTADKEHPAFIPPLEDAPSPPPHLEQPKAPLPPPSGPTFTPAILNESFDDTEESVSPTHSLSGNVAREIFEAQKETFETITTEKDVSEAVALLGGISLADLDPPSPGKYQNDAKPSSIHQNGRPEVNGNRPDVSPDAHPEENGNAHSGELTLADLESDIESSDMRRTPTKPTSGHVTRALRLADLDHKATEKRGASDYSSSIFSLTSSESEPEEDPDDPLIICDL